MACLLLTDQQRHCLTAVLQDMDPTAPRECRRWPRNRVLLTMWVRKLSRKGKPALFRISAVNFSKRGVGLLSRQQMSVGERFVLPVRFEDCGGRLVLCQVRNSREMEDGQFRVGAIFTAWVDDAFGDTPIPADWRA